MQHEAIRYSLDPKITMPQIAECGDYDIDRYAKLEERIQQNDI